MFKVPPIFSLPEQIELPGNMYKLHQITTACGEARTEILHGIQDKTSTPDDSVLEKRWDNVLEQLKDLKAQLADIRKSVETMPASKSVDATSKSIVSVPNNLQVLDGVVINAKPSSPPFALLLIQRLYKDQINLNISCHVHSTVNSSLPESIAQFRAPVLPSNGATKVNISLIWKEDLLDTELIANPIKHINILGEVNILRYLSRLGLAPLQHNADDRTEILVDAILDNAHRLVHVQTAKDRNAILKNFNGKLGKNSYFGGENIAITDIAVWSALKQVQSGSSLDLTQNLSKWFSRIDKILND